MCLILGLYIWFKYGGRFAFILQPSPHVIILTKYNGVLHATNRSGNWRIEKLNSRFMIKWFDLLEEPSEEIDIPNIVQYPKLFTCLQWIYYFMFSSILFYLGYAILLNVRS